MWWQANDFRVTVFFFIARQGNQLLASMQFVVLEQLASVCSDEWSMLKNHHKFKITKLNQLRAVPTSGMLINNLTNSSPAQGKHRNSIVTVQISVHPVPYNMLILIHSYTVAEWSKACPALKDCRDFKTSLCLWLLRAWVRIPSVVIFSDNQRLIQIVTLCLLFS